MSIPKDLFYTKSHEWVQKLDNGNIRLGLTDHAQQELGDIVFINLPEVDDEVTGQDRFADVESVKAVSDVYSPVGGRVVAINEELMDNPGMVNSAPYEAWLVELTEVQEEGNVMNAAAYEALLKEE